MAASRIAGSPFGLAYGAGSVWVGSRDGGRVNARERVDEAGAGADLASAAAPYALAFGGGSVWVSNEGSGTVSRIAPKRNKVVEDDPRRRPARTGSPSRSARSGSADYGRGRLIRIDPVRNRVEQRISLPKADWITASADALWVSSETGKIYRVDPRLAGGRSDRRPSARTRSRATWIGGKLWVPNIDDSHRLGRRPGDELGASDDPVGRARSPSPRRPGPPGSRRTSTERSLARSLPDRAPEQVGVRQQEAEREQRQRGQAADVDAESRAPSSPPNEAVSATHVQPDAQPQARGRAEEEREEEQVGQPEVRARRRSPGTGNANESVVKTCSAAA